MQKFTPRQLAPLGVRGAMGREIIPGFPSLVAARGLVTLTYWTSAEGKFMLRPTSFGEQGRDGLAFSRFLLEMNERIVYFCLKIFDNQILKLRINDKIYNHFLWLLQRLKKDEIQIIHEDREYLSVQEYLKRELHLLEEGKQEYLTPEELDKNPEQTIGKYED